MTGAIFSKLIKNAKDAEAIFRTGPESVKLIARIEDILKETECNENKIKDRLFYTYLNRGESGEYINYFYPGTGLNPEYDETAKKFNEDYPDPICWFQVKSLNNRSLSYITVNGIDIAAEDMRSLDLPPDNEEVLTMLNTVLEMAIQYQRQMNDGTYISDILEKLPVKNKYGMIQRNIFWKAAPYERTSLIGELSASEAERFENLAAIFSETEYGRGTYRQIRHMTFGKYLATVSAVYREAYGCPYIGNPVRFYAKYENVFGSWLPDIKFHSVRAFRRWFDSLLNGEANPDLWNIGKNTSAGEKIFLEPVEYSNGFIYKLYGDPLPGSLTGIVRVYNALQKEQVPFFMEGDKALADALSGRDYILIVPEFDTPDTKWYDSKTKRIMHIGDSGGCRNGLIAKAAWQTEPFLHKN